MSTRRRFIGNLIGAASVAAAAPALARLRDDSLDTIARVARATAGRDAASLADDETYWGTVQVAFDVDRTLVNLNNGGVCPSPRVVQRALFRDLEYTNGAPARLLWRDLEPRVEAVRQRLAREFGCDPEELAITRNASEALENVILGLDLEPGDEVLATAVNYPRMLSAWRQREQRDGIKLVTFDVPTNPADHGELLAAYERHITPRTRVIEVCHVVNLNGQIYPIREISEMAHARGIDVVVDGAHAFAHFPFKRDDLGCDFYGTSLHKWLLAPIGTGFLYVRKDRIPDVWPLMAASEPRSGDIRKFEEIGTHPAANHNAVAEALTFHQGIGIERKAARLRYLSRYWIGKVANQPGVRLLTNDDPAHACGLRLVSVEGVAPGPLTSHLWNKHRIIVCPIDNGDFRGLRVTPNVYTTLEELDRFAEALEGVVRNGLPG